MKSIQYNMNKNNTISFKGTNQIIDCLIHLLAIPFRGFHLGWYMVFKKEYPGILDYIREHADLSQPLNIEAISYGATSALFLIWRFKLNDIMQIGTVTLKGCPRFCKEKNFKYYKGVPIVSYRCGRDIVTFVPPWLTHPAKYKTIPNTKKSAWKFWHWFLDHARY
jgi:hypothetical protein